MENNNSIYVWRVIFTYIIALHHLRNCFGQTTYWYIAVDFFAIISGTLMVSHINRVNDNETTWDYIIKKFWQFSPLIIVTSLIRLLVEVYYNPLSLSTIISKILFAIPDFLLINSYYIGGSLNSVDWYIQMLFTLSIPLYYLLKNNKDFTVNFVAPVFCLMVYSYIFNEFHYLEGYVAQKKILQGVINLPLLRIGGGVFLGVLCYYWIPKIKKINSKIRMFIECVSLVSVILFSKFWGKNSVELLYIIVLFVGIAFAFTHRVKLPSLIYQFIQYLSGLSIYIYLSHYILRIIFRNEFSDYDFRLVIFYLLCCTFFSVILQYTLKVLNRNFQSVKIIKK